MNKKIYLLPILLLALVFTSCEETKEVSRYDNWQARNEAFIDSLYNVYTTAVSYTHLDVYKRQVAMVFRFCYGSDTGLLRILP